MARKSRKTEVVAQPEMSQIEALAELAQIGEAAGIETPEFIQELIAEDQAIEAALAELTTADFIEQPADRTEGLSDEQLAEIDDHAGPSSEDDLSDMTSGIDETTEEAPPTEPSFADLVGAVSDEDAEGMAHSIKAQIDDREDFEMAKNPENDTMKRTLKGVRSKLVTKRAARVLVAAGVDEGFINRSLHDGTRYNVYALGKLADVVYGLSEGQIQNAINRACMKSLFQCRAAGIAFTGELARASASDKLRVEAAVRQHLMRHTVSASTAPTQASSTMQALQTLGIVKTEGTSRNPTYIVTDTPIARAFEKLAA